MTIYHLKHMNVFKKLSQASSPVYMIQLDSLRVLALFGAMIEHYVLKSIYSFFLSSLKPAFPLEWESGNTLFFVLSTKAEILRNRLRKALDLPCKDFINVSALLSFLGFQSRKSGWMRLLKFALAMPVISGFELLNVYLTRS